MAGERPIEVPYTELAPDTLRTVVESFLGREGTDYGAVELTMDEKVGQALADFARGEAFLVFEANTETLRIVDKREILEVRAYEEEFVVDEE